MNMKSKTWLIIAVILVVAGIIMFAAVMSEYNWDFTKLSTVKYVSNTYEVIEPFNNISIDVETTKIEFVLSDGDECRINCYELDKLLHHASVQDGTLVINTTDTRKWYDYICISIVTPKMTVYLPEHQYSSLRVETDTGDVTVPSTFSFENLEVNGDTSDVTCFASVTDTIDISVSTGDIKVEGVTVNRLNLSTSTGKINVSSVTVQNDIDIETDTGAVKLTDVTCENFKAEGDTGKFVLKNVIASGSLYVDNETGGVVFEHSDAAEISVKTSTGDVTGSLLTEKVFVTETSTGKISVPNTTSGGKCEIKTSTGDIKITID